MRCNSERYSQIVKNPKGENDGGGMPINLAQSLCTVYSAELKFQEPCFSREISLWVEIVNFPNISTFSFCMLVLLHKLFILTCQIYPPFPIFF